MLLPLVSEDKLAQVRNLIEHCYKVSIVCHLSPDGDAVGASLCLLRVLKAMRKSAFVIFPDCPPESLRFLPDIDEAVVASYHPEKARSLLAGAQLIFCLDFNSLQRLSRLAPMVEASSARRILIDHHLEPDIDADVEISHPEKSSTCALLYTLLSQLGYVDKYVDTLAATYCCAGMMTDTGNFQYNSNDAQLYVILAELIAKGVDKDALYTRLFNINSENRLRIMGYCQYNMRIFPEHQAALITLSHDEIERLGYVKGDTEGLVNVPLSIPGITYSVYLREDETDYVKVSMRSKGEFSVKSLCEQYFAGGGHKNASGGEMRTSLTEAVKKVMEVMHLSDSMLPPIDNV